jgi:hypothetical protein
MKLSIQSSHVLIGAKATTEQAINLPLVAPDESFFTVNDRQYVSYFCALPESAANDDKASRCIHLLKQLMVQVAQDGVSFPLDTPVFWLLPEMPEMHESAVDNTDDFASFAKKLQGALPSLFTHPQSQLFPFGRASFSIGLTAAKTLFEQHDVETITFISVDSLWPDIAKLIADDALVSATSEGGIVPAEGAIFSQITRADEGLSVVLVQNLVAPSKQRTAIVKQLFDESVACLAEEQEQQGAQQAPPVILSHLYLPGNGDAGLQEAWLAAYYQLSGYVDDKITLCQSALFTGELGCVTGLYNFLHIVNGYKNEYLQGKVLQLEVSDSLHQGVVLYSGFSSGFSSGSKA